MGITIIPLGGHDGPATNLHTNNAFAGTLESTFGGNEVPAGFFRQGLVDMDPITLSPEDCATLADALDGLSDDDLDARLRAVYDPGLDDDYALGIAFIRQIGDLAGLNAGLGVR